jgi:predicted XRE-type DNA-binding protein
MAIADPTKSALGGNQMNPTGAVDATNSGSTDPSAPDYNASKAAYEASGQTPEQYYSQAQGVTRSAPALGGNQVGTPGVPQNPNDPTVPGYTYGAGATAGGIQGSVAGGVPNYDTTRVDANGMPVQTVGSGQQYMDEMRKAYMESAQASLDPQWNQRQAELENQLTQQGLVRGSSAWNAAMGDMGRERQGAYAQAQRDAILTSGTEAERMQRMGIAGGEFANKQAQQDFVNKMASQTNYNAALKEKFEANMASGRFANEAQAQEAAQKALDAQIRNAAMGTQEAGTIEREKISAQKEQFNQTLEQNKYQFSTMSAQEQEKINNQAAQFGMTYEQKNAQQRQEADQFAAQLGMTGQQLDAQVTQWAEQNGISKEQMAQQLAISTSQMTQQDKQFYAGLSETRAQREQMASQFAQTYELQTAAQRAQVDQFAQTLGMTGKQLDAQISQWAAQNGLSREQMANALAIAQTQAQATMAAANAQAAASGYAADVNADTQRARLAQETTAWAQQIARQQSFDPLLRAQLGASILNMGGTVPGSTTTPTTPK